MALPWSQGHPAERLSETAKAATAQQASACGSATIDFLGLMGMGVMTEHRTGLNQLVADEQCMTDVIMGRRHLGDLLLPEEVDDCAAVLRKAGMDVDQQSTHSDDLGLRVLLKAPHRYEV